MSVPPEALARLKRAESRQRNETKRRGLKAEPVSVDGLLLLQHNLCGCKCGDPLDFISKWDEKSPPPGYPVIAHRLARGSLGEHTPKNVSIDRWACNKRDASPDTSGAASVKRFKPDMTRKHLAKDERPRSKIPPRPLKSNPKLQSRPFPKVKGSWPKRTFR